MGKNCDNINQEKLNMDMQKLLLDEIRLLRKQVQCIERDLVHLKATSGFWGAISGCLTAVGVMAFQHFRK